MQFSSDDDNRYSSVTDQLYYGSPGVALSSVFTAEGVVLLHRDMARILEHCAAPKSLISHTAHIAPALGLGVDAAAAAVQALVSAGLLVPESAGMSSTVHEEPSTAGSVDTLGVVTANRPRELARSLRSYRQNCRSHGRRTTFVVVDGSDGRDSADATRDEVFCGLDGTESAIYIGSRQRRQLWKAAAEAGFPGDIVSWAVPDPTDCYAAGATRNLLMLASAGTRLVTVDDDTVCSLRRCDWHEEGIAFVGHGDPREAVWFANRADSINAGQRQDSDLLRLHESILGEGLRSLQSASKDMCDTEGACRHLTSVLQGFKKGRVRATWLGVAGDGAQYCPYSNLFATGRTRDRMASDESVFQMALSSREVIRGTRRTTVTDEPALMLYCAGLDCGQLLPPFNPTGFNEDGLFGALLRVCDRSAYIAHIATAIVHDSTRRSWYEPQIARSAAEVRLTDVLLRIMRSWASTSVTSVAEERMKELGRYFRTWASLNASEFRQHLKNVMLEAKWQMISKCESVALSGFDYPHYWRRSLDDYRDTLYNSVTHADFYIPVEYRVGQPSPESLAVLQRHIGMFGRLLCLWPDLWRWAVHHKDWTA